MEKLYENDGFALAGSENGETSNRVNTSFGDEINQTTENRKRKEPEGSSSEQPDDGEDDSHVQKKTRVVWTSEMHRKFVEAIAQLGEDRAFPKKILEVMNEPGLTKENVASHLQKYRISLKKSQEERDGYFEGLNAAPGNSKTPYFYNSSVGNCQQQHYMGTSQIGSRNYLPVSTSNDSSLYRINYTGIGTSGVRLAPPSYSPLNVLTWAINDGNMHKQYSLGTEVNGNFKDDHAGEEGDKMLGILNKRPCINTSDIHATSSSPGNSAFLGLRMANDGKSLVFGDSNGTEVVSTKRNDFNVGNGAQDFALPPFPDSEDQFEEPSLPPLPEFYVEYSLPQLETTNTSLPPITSQWNPNTDMASYSFVSHEDFLSPLPSSEMPLNLYGDFTATNFVPQNSLLPPLASESQCNVNPDASTTISVSNNFQDHEILLPCPPSEIPWSSLELDDGSVPSNI